MPPQPSLRIPPDHKAAQAGDQDSDPVGPASPYRFGGKHGQVVRARNAIEMVQRHKGKQYGRIQKKGRIPISAHTQIHSRLRHTIHVLLPDRPSRLSRALRSVLHACTFSARVAAHTSTRESGRTTEILHTPAVFRATSSRFPAEGHRNQAPPHSRRRLSGHVMFQRQPATACPCRPPRPS